MKHILQPEMVTTLSNVKKQDTAIETSGDQCDVTFSAGAIDGSKHDVGR